MYELDRFDFAIVWKNKKSGKKKKMMMKKYKKGQSASAFAACLSTRLSPCCLICLIVCLVTHLSFKSCLT